MSLQKLRFLLRSSYVILVIEFRGHRGFQVNSVSSQPKILEVKLVDFGA